MNETNRATGTVVMGGTPRAGTVVMGDTVVQDARSQAATISAESIDATLAQPLHVTLTSPSSQVLLRNTVLPRFSEGAHPTELAHNDRPRYERKGLLGEGGVGEVVKTVDNDIERTVAIKRLKADMRSPGHLARFVEEIRTIGSMEHPNIVPIHDVGVDEEGQYFFVMKYVEGETLESILDKLAKGDPIAHAVYSFERRCEIFLGVLEAIAYAHARGIIHRDIKPANVMVGPFGEVTVMDWGLARKVKDPTPDPLPSAPEPDAASPAPSRAMFRTRVGTVLGTPAYMSPEQARGETLDERSDIYSLSVMFHEMLCLQHYLHEATTLDMMLLGVQQRSVRPAAFVSSPHQPPTPADLTHYAQKGVAKDPNQRYQTVQAMIDRLRRRAEGDFPIQCPVTFAKRSTLMWSHFIDRHPFLLVAVMALSLLAGLGGAGSAILHAIH